MGSEMFDPTLVSLMDLPFIHGLADVAHHVIECRRVMLFVSRNKDSHARYDAEGNIWQARTCMNSVMYGIAWRRMVSALPGHRAHRPNLPRV